MNNREKLKAEIAKAKEENMIVSETYLENELGALDGWDKVMAYSWDMRERTYSRCDILDMRKEYYDKNLDSRYYVFVNRLSNEIVLIDKDNNNLYWDSFNLVWTNKDLVLTV